MQGSSRVTRKLIQIAILAAGLTSLGCNAIVYPPKRSVYVPARQALASLPGIPREATLDPDRNAEVYIAKNAATVVMDVEYKAENGATVRRSYTVWMKRLGRRWELDRAFPTPVYE